MRKFMLKKRFSLPEAIGLIGIAVICVSVVSYAVTVPNTFTSGTTAKSGEVNANFAALVSAVTALEGQVATQQSEITALQANNALLLDQYLTISSGTIEGLAGPHVILTGANLHIRNGSGATSTINGVGNLVVGYNEEVVFGLEPGDRGGSHNLIVGPEHRYLSSGGLVAGFGSTLSGRFASVSGGWRNTASAEAASVSGGYANDASGLISSISGGYNNDAANYASSVSGGRNNTASGQYSSVSGGYSHTMITNYGWMACGTYTCSDSGP